MISINHHPVNHMPNPEISTTDIVPVLRSAAAHTDAPELAAKLTSIADGLEFWDMVYPNGMSPEAVMNELLDFQFIIEQLPKVYYAVTNGTLSKHMYPAETVISLFEDTVTEACMEAVDDAFELLEAQYCPEGVAIGTYVETLEERIATLEALLEEKSERQIEADRE